MDKSTQEIHIFHIADTPAGPLDLAYNLESRWFGATLPKEIPIEYMDLLLVGLGIVRNYFDDTIKDSAAIRSDVEADWEQLNRLAARRNNDT